MKTLLSSVFIAVVASGFALAAEEKAAGFEDRMKAAGAALEEAAKKGDRAYFLESETLGRALLKDFPDKEEPYEMLLIAASNLEADRARPIIKALSTEKAPAEIRERAKGIERKLDMVGKPLDLKFKAVDGRAVDVGGLKGKVVLVDFWATWCPPCVAEIPHVKELYEKLGSKGFEVIGISFDDDKDSLENFIKDKQVTWPQYFDGQGWSSPFSQKYGIATLPSMWLVNKKGELVDIAAGNELEAKVGKLLAE